MSDFEQPPKVHKLHVKWIALGFLVLLVALFLLQLFGGSFQIVVSKQTTYITVPLAPDGLPDYKAHIIQQDSQGVTPENNAAVLIWQATWPGELAQKHWLLMANALGMKEVPTGEDSLVTVHSNQVREQVSAELTDRYSQNLAGEQLELLYTPEWQDRMRDEFADLTIDEAKFHPWTSEQLPSLAAWVEANQKPLDMLIEAAARHKYYSPSPTFLNGDDSVLLSMLLPDIQSLRSCVRSISARAMGHVGEGRMMEAWRDIHACFGLARHVSNNQTLIGQLVGIAMNGMACRGATVLLQSNDLTEADATQILADLQALPPVSDIAFTLTEGERLFYLDSVMHLASGKLVDEAFLVDANSPLNLVSKVAINWNHVLRQGNQWYDRLTEVARKPTREKRIQAFNQIDNELRQIASTVTTPSTVVGGVFSRSRRSEMISSILISLFLPALSSASQAEDRGMAQQQLTTVAAALAVYRTQNGSYPESLEELSPKILPVVPLDLYSTKPFIYERIDEGYLLYSVFENGLDDGGTDHNCEIINGEWVEQEPEDFDRDASDLVIRVPQPAFKFPKNPLKESGEE